MNTTESQIEDIKKYNNKRRLQEEGANVSRNKADTALPGNFGNVADYPLLLRACSTKRPTAIYNEDNKRQNLPDMMIKPSSAQKDNDNSFDLTESSGDDNADDEIYATSNIFLRGIREEDLLSLATKDIYVRAMCVHVIIENINETMDTNVISCVSTEFYSLLLRGELKKARGLLHPDELCLEGTNTQWHTPDSRKASAKSGILLIPCHDEKAKH